MRQHLSVQDSGGGGVEAEAPPLQVEPLCVLSTQTQSDPVGSSSSEAELRDDLTRRTVLQNLGEDVRALETQRGCSRTSGCETCSPGSPPNLILTLTPDQDSPVST